ncbi:MAG TPA: hypothetical protein VHM25_22890 [Polyangiaceae bacterium]|nr:hypothetical protein [Polyangiaceae bacterium]
MSFRRLSLLLALPTVVGLSLAACGTEDDAASGPPSGGSGPTAGSGGSEETGGGTGGNGASGGTNPEGGMGGSDEPGPGGAGGDSAGGAGAGGDSAGGAGGDSPGAGGEGGAPGPVVCHNILQAFDTNPGGSMGKYLTPSTGPVQSSTVEWSSTEGVIAAGAGKLNATFGALGEQAQLSIYFPAGTQWPTCNTKMHAKVKIISAVDLSHLNGIALNINSGTGSRYSSQFVSTATWMMDTWYELELPFATANYQNPANTLPDFTDVNSMGVMLQTKSAGNPPVATTLYVDDVWVE